MKRDSILVIGASGQLGRKLMTVLKLRYGSEQVLTAETNACRDETGGIPDVVDYFKLRQVIKNFSVTQVYLLPADLSVIAELQAVAVWNSQIKSLLEILELARELKLEKVFWPGSYAVFGSTSPRHSCPQNAVTEPATAYGSSRMAGEYWCDYYFKRYGVDVRSLRLPGLVCHSVPPGSCITDYTAASFDRAHQGKPYTCFLNEDTCLPMIYMPDAIRAILELMDAPAERITIRTAYNVTGMSFAPCDLVQAIRHHIPDFKIQYEPDLRQAIAASWPVSIDDQIAQKDWGWKASYNLQRMTADILAKLAEAKVAGPGLPELSHEYFPDFPIDHYPLRKTL